MERFVASGEFTWENISIYSNHAIKVRGGGDNTGATISATTVANDAIFVPILVVTAKQAERGFWYNAAGALAGNVDVGIFNVGGLKICSTGSVALSGINAIQDAAMATPTIIPPGQYYMGIEFSTSTANNSQAHAASILSRYWGVMRQAVGSFPLPATATFAAWTSTILPAFGISFSTVDN